MLGEELNSYTIDQVLKNSTNLVLFLVLIGIILVFLANFIPRKETPQHMKSELQPQ